MMIAQVRSGLLLDEVTLLVEVFDALDNRRVVASVHVCAEGVEDVDLALEEHNGVEVSEDVCGEDDRLRLVCLPEHFLEVFLEVVGVGAEAAVEESVAFELFLFADPFPLFQLRRLHQLGVVERRLPEEVDLSVLELLRLALQVVGNLVVGHPILQVLFPVIVAHDLVELLELEPSSGQDCLHDSLNWPLHRLGVDALDGVGSEHFEACEVLDDGAGHKATDAVGRAVLVGQVLHLLRVLVHHQQFADLHLIIGRQEKIFAACSISF